MTPDDHLPRDAAPGGTTSRGARWRLAGLVAAFVVVAAALQLSGWNGPERLQELVESTGWAGVLVFVAGYALFVLVPTPASVLTILGGALFGLWWGALLAWAGALIGAVGGFALGRRLGRSSVDRLLHGRLRQADQVLSDHGVVAVLAVRLVPIFPFAPLNYASGLLGVRVRDYVVGSGIGIIPGAVAYAAVGAAGADPLGLILGIGGLLGLTLVGGLVGRRLLASSTRRAEAGGTADPGQVSAGTPRSTAGRSTA